MDTLPDTHIEDSDDEFVKVPLRELVIFGDPLQTTEPEQAWERVRKLHNTFRLTTLRSPPALQLALEAHYKNPNSSDAMFDEVTKHCPHFVRPADAPAYSNRFDALQRHNMGGGIFVAPHSGVRLGNPFG